MQKVVPIHIFQVTKPWLRKGPQVTQPQEAEPGLEVGGTGKPAVLIRKFSGSHPARPSVAVLWTRVCERWSWSLSETRGPDPWNPGACACAWRGCASLEPEMQDGPTLPGRAGWQHGSSGVQEEGRASEPRGPARILQPPARGSGQCRPAPTWILAHFNPSWTSHPQHRDPIRLCLSEPRSLWAFVAAEVGNQRSRYPRAGRGGFLRACVSAGL